VARTNKATQRPKEGEEVSIDNDQLTDLFILIFSVLRFLHNAHGKKPVEVSREIVHAFLYKSFFEKAMETVSWKRHANREFIRKRLGEIRICR